MTTGREGATTSQDEMTIGHAGLTTGHEGEKTVIAETETVHADAETVIANAETVIANAETVIANAETVTPGTKTVIADAETVPADTETVTPGTETVPAGTKTVTPGTETVPADTETVIANAETVIADTETVTPGTETVPAATETVTPGTKTVTADAETVTPGTETVTPGTKTVIAGTETVIADAEIVTAATETITADTETVPAGLQDEDGDDEDEGEGRIVNDRIQIDTLSTVAYTPGRVGKLDQFAKDVFAEDTPIITHGALAYQPPSELNLSEVRLDGMLLVHDPDRLPELPAPWSQAHSHDEIVLEVKMQGDHLDRRATERALLRRQARLVQRLEEPKTTWDGDVPLWLIASHVPEVLRRRHDLERIAPGCYRVGPAWFSFLWIAANELPLREELIPFLIARSGRALDEFGRWISTQRSPDWLLRMLEFLPMSNAVIEEMFRFVSEETDDPFMKERQLLFLRRLAEIIGLRDELVQEGLAPLAHQFERRLGRNLTTDERSALRERLRRVGPDRLGDVVLDLAPAALAAWLADPDAR